MAKYVAAIDQGTTSTRFMIFDHASHVVGTAQLEHKQIYPKPGWVEHDAMEIWRRTQEVIAAALAQAKIQPDDIAAVGVTNQRETVVVWDRATGKPICNAVVWQDTRTADICRDLAKGGGQDQYRRQTGLPITTYFSGPKIKWILDHVRGARVGRFTPDVLLGLAIKHAERSTVVRIDALDPAGRTAPFRHGSSDQDSFVERQFKPA